MGAAAYNRGSRAIRASVDRDRRRPSEPRAACAGRMANGPDKRFARCTACRHVDYEANEGDRCRCTHPIAPRP